VGKKTSSDPHKWSVRKGGQVMGEKKKKAAPNRANFTPSTESQERGKGNKNTMVGVNRVIKSKRKEVIQNSGRKEKKKGLKDERLARILGNLAAKKQLLNVKGKKKRGSQEAAPSQATVHSPYEGEGRERA